jgi:hypothetical protein
MYTICRHTVLVWQRSQDLQPEPNTRSIALPLPGFCSFRDKLYMSPPISGFIHIKPLKNYKRYPSRPSSAAAPAPISAFRIAAATEGALVGPAEDEDDDDNGVEETEGFPVPASAAVDMPDGAWEDVPEWEPMPEPDLELGLELVPEELPAPLEWDGLGGLGVPEPPEEELGDAGEAAEDLDVPSPEGDEEEEEEEGEEGEEDWEEGEEGEEGEDGGGEEEPSQERSKIGLLLMELPKMPKAGLAAPSLSVYHHTFVLPKSAHPTDFQ